MALHSSVVCLRSMHKLYLRDCGDTGRGSLFVISVPRSLAQCWHVWHVPHSLAPRVPSNMPLVKLCSASLHNLCTLSHVAVSFVLATRTCHTLLGHITRVTRVQAGVCWCPGPGWLWPVLWSCSSWGQPSLHQHHPDTSNITWGATLQPTLYLQNPKQNNVLAGPWWLSWSDWTGRCCHVWQWIQ